MSEEPYFILRKDMTQYQIQQINDGLALTQIIEEGYEFILLRVDENNSKMEIIYEHETKEPISFEAPLFPE